MLNSIILKTIKTPVQEDIDKAIQTHNTTYCLTTYFCLAPTLFCEINIFCVLFNFGDFNKT